MGARLTFIFLLRKINITLSEIATWTEYENSGRILKKTGNLQSQNEDINNFKFHKIFWRHVNDRETHLTCFLWTYIRTGTLTCLKLFHYFLYNREFRTFDFWPCDPGWNIRFVGMVSSWCYWSLGEAILACFTAGKCMKPLPLVDPIPVTEIEYMEFFGSRRCLC